MNYIKRNFESGETTKKFTDIIKRDEKFNISYLENKMVDLKTLNLYENLKPAKNYFINNLEKMKVNNFEKLTFKQNHKLNYKSIGQRNNDSHYINDIENVDNKALNRDFTKIDYFSNESKGYIQNKDVMDFDNKSFDNNKNMKNEVKEPINLDDLTEYLSNQIKISHLGLFNY